MAKHDHNHLVQLALQWLRGTRKCEVYVGEPRRWNSIQSPDALGWKGTGWSIAVECKVSRSDLLKQRRKLYRQAGQLAVGQERWVLVPRSLRITQEDWLTREHRFPDWPFRGWGLLEARGGKVYRIVYPTDDGPAGDDTLDLQRLVVEAPFLVQIAREAQNAGRKSQARVERLERYQTRCTEQMRELADLGEQRDRLREMVAKLGGVDCTACSGTGRVETPGRWRLRCDACGGSGLLAPGDLQPCSAGCDDACRRGRPERHKPAAGPLTGPARGVEAGIEAVAAHASPSRDAENGRSRNGGETT